MNIKNVFHPQNNDANPFEFALLPIILVFLIAAIAKGFHIQFDLLHAILTGYLIHLQRDVVVKVVEPFVLQIFPVKNETKEDNKTTANENEAYDRTPKN